MTNRKPKAKTVVEAPVERVEAFKAFDADFKCRGFQYEVGQTYRQDEPAVICRSGFHACEIGFDVWRYYEPGASRYAVVELVGPVVRHDEDSKVAAAEIVIKAELKLPEFIRQATAKLVAWIASKADSNIATGTRGHAAATGARGHAAATGARGHAAATGCSGHAAATGDSGHAAATGTRGHAAATGSRGHAAATGYSGHAAATGYSGHAAATGYRGHAAATGDSGHAAATGYRGHAAATGDRGHAAATGARGHAAATGCSGHAAATGDRGIAASLGPYGTASAGPTGAVMLAAYDDDLNLVAVFASKVGENGIEVGKTYRLGTDGTPVEIA